MHVAAAIGAVLAVVLAGIVLATLRDVQPSGEAEAGGPVAEDAVTQATFYCG
jgi:hypothetical protein